MMLGKQYAIFQYIFEIKIIQQPCMVLLSNYNLSGSCSLLVICIYIFCVCAHAKVLCKDDRFRVLSCFCHLDLRPANKLISNCVRLRNLFGTEKKLMKVCQ
ncbi:hypothetical protein ACOSP7_013086 [Xanthoceras sorbifolium]